MSTILGYLRVLLDANGLQCSLSHQLLPKDQQTKPEEVRSIHLSAGICAYRCIGLPVPDPHHQAD